MSKVRTAGGRGKLFVISAPSGCGKTTLCKKLLEGNIGLAHSVSVTTRPPRPGERDGIDYRFVSRKKFKDFIDRDEFLEYEENFGNFYGTPGGLIDEALSKGKPVLLSIDVKGAMKVRRAYPKESVLIFILPPSIEALGKRLKYRMSDGDDAISRRLKLARREISYKKKYDYNVVNDRLGRTYKKLEEIIVSELSRLNPTLSNSWRDPAIWG